MGIPLAFPDEDDSLTVNRRKKDSGSNSVYLLPQRPLSSEISFMMMDQKDKVFPVSFDRMRCLPS